MAGYFSPVLRTLSRPVMRFLPLRYGMPLRVLLVLLLPFLVAFLLLLLLRFLQRLHSCLIGLLKLAVALLLMVLGLSEEILIYVLLPPVMST